ncbi:MAG: hypothetical protein L3J28_03290 [Candidatus Polarisedimenticolaceae bacterium]|nr:hypothetical protein [Candidatus Polarisedimenticolaceae bacterium]
MMTKTTKQLLRSLLIVTLFALAACTAESKKDDAMSHTMEQKMMPADASSMGHEMSQEDKMMASDPMDKEMM